MFEQQAKFLWTPEREAVVKDERGKRTPFAKIITLLTEIAGIEPSKNTVIGKANRLGLCEPKRSIKDHRTPNPFAALAGDACLFPVGHPGDADFHFCGAPKVDHIPFCAAHGALCYLKPKDADEKLAA